MDALLDTLAHLDWFERVDEWFRALCGVRSWRFKVPRDCGLSGHEIEQLLCRHGVSIWGRNFDQAHLFFRVKRCQANWAEYLLSRRGIPVQGPLFNPLNRSYRARHYPGSEPPPTDRPSSAWGWLDELLSLFSE